TVRRMELDELVGQLAAIAPENVATRRIERDHLRPWRRDVHDALVHDRRRLVALASPRGKGPGDFEVLDVAARDLVERTVAPPVVAPAEHQPVLRLRIEE